MPNFPKYIDLEFTARCNLKCGFCFGPVDHGRKDLDLDQKFWIRVIDEICKRGSEGIVVSGGEPTLYPGLAVLLEYAKGCGLKTVVSTHGRHTSRVLEIARYCDWIALPVDAMESSSLQRLRGDSWGVVAASRLAMQIKASAHHTFIKLGTVATAQNVDQIVHLAKALAAGWHEEFDTWKIYQYTPRRKFKESREIYELADAEYIDLSRRVEATGACKLLHTVFSSNESRRGAYLFVYPDATVASPNNGEDYGDVVLGNLVNEGMGVFDRIGATSIRANGKNFLSTYNAGNG